MRKPVAVGSTVAAVVLLDQVTKALVAHYIEPNRAVEVIPGLFNIVYWTNPGAAFGIFRSGGALRTVLLSAMSIVALAVVAVLLRRSRDRLTTLALSLIAGGAVGNLIDRARFGEVVDFLDFYIGRHHWPAFNVADSAITVGALMALAGFYFMEGRG